MFTGREWIAELGVYDYRNRYYHPALGRFLQTDPKGFDAGDMNLFRYVADDPVDLTDPTGLYGRARDEWSDKEWQKYSTNQERDIQLAQTAKNAIDHARQDVEDKTSKATINAFQKIFGLATKENMANVSNDLAKKLTALRDDGRNGFCAH